MSINQAFVHIFWLKFIGGKNKKKSCRKMWIYQYFILDSSTFTCVTQCIYSILHETVDIPGCQGSVRDNFQLTHLQVLHENFKLFGVSPVMFKALMCCRH